MVGLGDVRSTAGNLELAKQKCAHGVFEVACICFSLAYIRSITLRLCIFFQNRSINIDICDMYVIEVIFYSMYVLIQYSIICDNYFN